MGRPAARRQAQATQGDYSAAGTTKGRARATRKQQAGIVGGRKQRHYPIRVSLIVAPLDVSFRFV